MHSSVLGASGLWPPPSSAASATGCWVRKEKCQLRGEMPTEGERQGTVFFFSRVSGAILVPATSLKVGLKCGWICSLFPEPSQWDRAFWSIFPSLMFSLPWMQSRRQQLHLYQNTLSCLCRVLKKASEPFLHLSRGLFLCSDWPADAQFVKDSLPRNLCRCRVIPRGAIIW